MLMSLMDKHYARSIKSGLSNLIKHRNNFTL
ncbi:hypothetical protein T10_7403 [Trichinella papuae]|uniref:Uncharacterized protein n=1 Tax=Trichinella papuae TaxID=268474 RepID=A0A0V1LX95_9BILA|nr:hypothetical protein T10_7403 [Trichinella papuae]